MRQDFRFALRMIASHRWFSAAVVVTLALGIGLNTMVFTLIYAVLLKPVPVPGGERLVSIMSQSLGRAEQGRRRQPVSLPDFRDYRAHVTSLEALEAAQRERAVISEPGIAPHRYDMNRISAGLFSMLHASPIQGRGFQPADAMPGAPPVILLSHAVWKERYSAANVIGRVVRVNEKSATIIGVMPAGFRFPEDQDLWMPLVPTAELEDRSNRSLQLFGMLKPGVSRAQATADLSLTARQLASQYPKADKDLGALVQTFHQRYNGDEIAVTFLLMMAAVGSVLLIACANVANMMLGRALRRQREISIRAAMGASRLQLIRQLLIESLLLSSIGGIAGLGLAALGVHAFDLATRDVGKPYWILFTMDYSVFGYFAAICILSALLFGLVPSLRSSRVDLNTALKDGSRGSAGSLRGGKLSGALVAFQFALTLVLLMGAGVFMRSFIDKQSINRWIPADRIMTARINLPKTRYRDDAARQAFYDRLLPQVAVLPGIVSASIVSDLPADGSDGHVVEPETHPIKDPLHSPSASVLVASPGYLRTIGLSILSGRDLENNDGEPGRRATVVSREFAARYWPKGGALGKRIRFYDGAKPGDWMTVVGIAREMVQKPREATPDPLVFVPYRQDSYESMSLVVRTAGNPAAIISALLSSVQNLDQDLPLSNIRTLAENIHRQFWFLQVFGTIFFTFAFIAMVMASVGIYAVMAQSAGSRTKEIGVRMALGATSIRIQRLVLKRGALQLAAGLGLGLIAAWPAARVMSGLRFLTAPSDPLLVAAIAATLGFVGIFACWLPARRAAALHPVSALRNE